jgi:tartrate dehydrogenase/decarboxylase/D-malate dehydrogenase
MSSAIRKHKIAVVPGDGIGIEVVAAAVDVLKTLVKKLGGFELEFTDFDWGSESSPFFYIAPGPLCDNGFSPLWCYADVLAALYKKTGHYAPETFLEDVKSYDAILFGSVGAPDVPDHISLWSLLLPLRQHLQQYINLRPSIVFPGVTPPLANVRVGDLDWLIVRENTEGEYSGQGGRTHVGTEWETATEVGIFTRKGIERVMRFAFEEARKRPKKFLTVVTKSNSMVSPKVPPTPIGRERSNDVSCAVLQSETDWSSGMT